MTEKFSFQYFAEEYCKFREYMGSREYMVEHPEKIQNALRGLLIVYFNVDDPEKNDQLKLMMSALIMELEMRQRLMVGLEIQSLLDQYHQKSGSAADQPTTAHEKRNKKCN